jgi:hypothetical protein
LRKCRTSENGSDDGRAATNQRREHRTVRVMPWDPRTASPGNREQATGTARRHLARRRCTPCSFPAVFVAPGNVSGLRERHTRSVPCSLTSDPWLQAGLRARARRRCQTPCRFLTVAGAAAASHRVPVSPAERSRARRTPARAILRSFAIIAALADLPASGTQAFHSHVRLPDERVRLGPHGRRARP